ncbi:MAG: CDP-alcohol phosphatidyltransferase [Frankiales bacterium]|nr:CDP-alcohol phosphatidyltransferase [Frankiales bacterium]
MTSSNGSSAAVPAPGPGVATGGPAVPVDRDDLGDRVWTVPNALSVLRLLGVPLFLWLLLGPHADAWAIVVLAVSGVTDWADGKLARLLDQSSRLGALLDPAADRLYIVATLIALALRDVVPLWLVLVLVGRELVLGVALLVLRRYGYPPLQVHYLGKAATFLLLYAFPCLLLADTSSAVAGVARPIAWALTIWGTALYLLAGLLYLVQVAGLIRAQRTGPPADAGATGGAP